jgi:DNA-binding PucR family transcriptional regulator
MSATSVQTLKQEHVPTMIAWVVAEGSGIVPGSLSNPLLARIAKLVDGDVEQRSIVVSVVESTRSHGEKILRAAHQAGCGLVWVGVSEAPIRDRALQESQEAVELGARIWAAPRVVLHTDEVPFKALAADRRLCRQVAHLLEPLRLPSHVELLRTTEVYVAAPSASAAARELGIHRHTLDYRIRQVEGLLGRSVRTWPDRFVVEAAVIARKLAR